MKIFKSAEELIGNTPLMELANYAEKHDLRARLLGKLECFNPGGSAKDRVAKAMLDDAEKAGTFNESCAYFTPAELYKKTT